MPKSVVVIGSVNADCVVAVDRLPVRGETLAARESNTGRFVAGGKGANQAAAVARLATSPDDDVTCQFVCQFGNDAQGQALEQALQGAGVDTSLSGHPSCPSGQAFVFVYPDGDNSIVIVGGANHSWPETLPERVVLAIQHAAIVLLQCEIPAAVNAAVLQCAAAHHVPVMLDSGGDDRAIPIDLLPRITFLCPNETELARLTQRTEITSVEQAIHAARALQAQGAQHVLVTLGALGSVFIPKADDNDTIDDVVHQPCLHVDADRVVDTTGAGDCFRGAFAVAQARGETIADSLRLAAAAAALCVQRAGALPSMPSEAETQALL